MRKYLLVLSLMLAATTVLAEQNLILLRHAEKLSDSPDPALTTNGHQRAICFANWLSEQPFAGDINVIYSSNYRRTLTTAATIAVKLDVPVRLYRPRNLAAIAAQLKLSPASAVVVGHSNTTPILAGILKQQAITKMLESDYDSFWHLRKVGGSYSIKELNQQQIACNFTSS